MRIFFLGIVVTLAVWFVSNVSIRYVEKPNVGNNGRTAQEQTTDPKARPAEVRIFSKLTEREQKSLDEIESEIFNNNVTITKKGGE